MKTLIVLLLVFFFLASILLDKAVRTYPLKELKRRAKSGKDKESAAIYKLASHGPSLALFLWLVGGISGAVLFLKTAEFSWLAATALLLVTVWVLLSTKPVGGFMWRVAANIANPANKIVDFLHPPLARLANLLKRLSPLHFHTGLYDKEDLLELINNQNHQIDNRIPEEDLKITFGSLTFGDKKVASVMTPKRVLKLVGASDSIGPLLMDDLHKSGFSRFPVVKDKTKTAAPEIVGTLYLKDLIGYEDEGKVKDLMKKGTYYINEEQSLREALAAFSKTQHHMLIVVNNFEEISGILTMEDVLEQILGSEIVDEFDRYDDMRAVAGLEAKKAHDHHTTQEQPKQS